MKNIIPCSKNMKASILALLTLTTLATSFNAEAVEVNIEKSVTLSWNSELQKTYRIDSSTDLKTWTVAVPFIQGTGEEIVRHFTMTDEKRFYRVEELTQPAWFSGVWKGTLYQSGGSSYETTIALDPETGELTSEYHPFCSGRLSLVSISETEAVFQEVITENTENCPFNGTVTIRRLPDNRVLYWWASDEISGGAFGFLNKQ